MERKNTEKNIMGSVIQGVGAGIWLLGLIFMRLTNIK